MYTKHGQMGFVQPIPALDNRVFLVHNVRMTTERLKALCESVLSSIDGAMHDLVWADNPEVFEGLKNAKELVELIAEDCEGDLDELNFDY